MKRPADENLHALADGRLEGEARREAEAWIAQNPDDAERVAQWRQQGRALHALFDPVREESMPARLAALPRPAAWRAAAAVAWVALGLGMGYAARGLITPAPQPELVLLRSAAVAHAAYVPEVRHPVEVAADQEAHLVAWLSKRLGTPIRAPHLGAAGYALLGGRLLPAEGGGNAAQFMYQSATGQRVTLYLRTGEKSNTGTAFRYAQQDGLAVFYWVEGDTGYALSGQLEREQLLQLATLAYRELNAAH
ncbi:MAG: anti-sigma factor [Rhodocyclaceae bacterium]|nr:anti-sigma factor [Rhodocyclaceae bacterium]MBX3670153.1 anti-sigma factor [Rhodocyclaceae bacterium]